MQEIKYIKYDSRLKQRASDLRKNQTLPEKLLWEKLRNKQFYWYKFIRQKMLWFFIADFYCSKLKLVIEIDWDSHYTENALVYDEERSQILKWLWLKIIRYTNDKIMKNIEWVIEDLRNKFW